jgi:cytochrome c oxidase subunit 3
MIRSTGLLARRLPPLRAALPENHMAPSVLTPFPTEVPPTIDDIGGNGTGSGNNGFGGGDGWEAREWSVPARTYHTGMWVALAAVTMVFSAFTSALVVRKGISNDWVTTAIPPILYLNTLLLMISSLTLELSRRALGGGRVARFRIWLYVTLGLGMAFIGGQWTAWKELATRGIYLATNPSSSFFYLLTAAHAAHLLGGIAALFYLVYRARTIALAPKSKTAVDVTALYWHFMDGLWIYILLLFRARL